MAAPKGYSVDREWDAGKVRSVAEGILQASGLWPRAAASSLASAWGASPSMPQHVVEETAYHELGRQVVELVREAAALKLKSPVTGGLLADPAELGYYIVRGRAMTAAESVQTSTAEVLETATLGMVDADNGGIDADVLSGLSALANAVNPWSGAA